VPAKDLKHASGFDAVHGKDMLALKAGQVLSVVPLETIIDEGIGFVNGR
jgi:hypothetical protein